ncbi:GNAT family N-acetyltransferase [Vallitalea okinawensis]|uniref:GNAT family N-acetyltransferase n=1 Tax=Vallitalea okinawensis TaxID=2078660 RepID=UPI000CFB2F99|nr:GNAT family N-acetyltransferase [Vallitalea okinawensis]
MEHNTYYKKYQLRNKNDLILRKPVASDAEALIDLMKKVDTESRFLAREPGEFDVSIEDEKKMITGRLSDSDSVWYVAEYNGAIVGQCSVGLVNKYKRYRHRAGVAFVVLKEYWNLGIGGKMMLECINWCKKNNVEQLELDVVVDNERAKAMYESFGFEVTGKIKNSLKYADNTYADEYSMMLMLE